MNHADLAPRSLALGLASGGRSSVGLGAVAATATPRKPWLVALAGAAVAGELVGDKLPSTPSRLQTASLVVRSLAGAAAAVLVARRVTSPTPTPVGVALVVPPEPVSTGRKAVRIVLPAAVGAAAGYAGSHLGATARASRPGWVTAVVEDAVSLAVAGWAVR